MTSSSSPTLVLASGNTGKLKEFSRLLAAMNLDIRPQSDWNVPEVAETGREFVDNALIKARHASRHTGLAAIADDSGLVVPALGGEPGVQSARFAGRHGDDEANNRLLLERMTDLDGAERAAYFQCVMVLVDSNENTAPVVASARWWGEITREPRGEGGFGYDPLFLVPEHACTSAQLEPRVKNRLSHRGRACRELLRLMQERQGGT